MEKQRPNLSSTLFCPKNLKASLDLPKRPQPMRKKQTNKKKRKKGTRAIAQVFLAIVDQVLAPKVS
jgi:hypothetical protein